MGEPACLDHPCKPYLTPPHGWRRCVTWHMGGPAWKIPPPSYPGAPPPRCAFGPPGNAHPQDAALSPALPLPLPVPSPWPLPPQTFDFYVAALVKTMWAKPECRDGMLEYAGLKKPDIRVNMKVCPLLVPTWCLSSTLSSTLSIPPI